MFSWLIRLPCYFCADEFWQNHPELHEIPIYYASSLAKKCMSVYQTYTHAMNEKIQRQLALDNPFQFKHIANLKVWLSERCTSRLVGQFFDWLRDECSVKTLL